MKNDPDNIDIYRWTSRISIDMGYISSVEDA
jgi:hypothetical protein